MPCGTVAYGGDTMARDIKERVRQRANVLLNDSILTDASLANYVDSSLPIPEVFVGTGEIRLIVLGQDPTVKRAQSRQRITTVLNLDKPGKLQDYLRELCRGLGLELDQNIYATNLIKTFLKTPPTQITEFNAVKRFGERWLPMLKEELAVFSHVPVLTLGEPLLSALVTAEDKPKVRNCWGYGHKDPSAHFKHFAAPENRLERLVFPFPHQPSLAKLFYRENLISYVQYMREQLGW
jgi:uracil-DNA glycosylase